ncbi:hypothetical protein BS50DRAFT_406809 [Corynespora cassiicola Philippines]|uniref:Uncharacterized protein n=1 Tax=Corynespora cassiicola Philippines TaxID=1448308 RepID=A0A2T2NLF9_CORCC|nr:hypothetical protein BS50DRAFT_406809 [Corynespora cassiicola Philippines]
MSGLLHRVDIMANSLQAGFPRSDEPPSPGFLSIPFGNLSAKGLDTSNTPYQMSYSRTPIYELPFPHPKWHVRYSTGQIYEVTSPILEEYDPMTGYIDTVEAVRESIEGKDCLDGQYKNQDHGNIEMVESKWNGYVSYPESCERSSIAREAKRAREEKEEIVPTRENKRARKHIEFD